MSMPRKELEAACLAMKIGTLLRQEMPYVAKREYYWTDSENVLAWIQNPPEDFKVFVSNRVRKIQTATKPQQWQHVKGVENPADLPSRGISAKDLVGSMKEKWLHGPEWLQQGKIPVPRVEFKVQEDARIEARFLGVATVLGTEGPTELEKYFLQGRDLSYKKLQQWCVWMLRFASWKRQIFGVRTKEEVLQNPWPTERKRN